MTNFRTTFGRTKTSPKCYLSGQTHPQQKKKANPLTNKADTQYILSWRPSKPHLQALHDPSSSVKLSDRVNRVRLPCHLDVTQNTTCRDAPLLSQVISGRPDVPPTDKRKRSKSFAATAARTKAHGVFSPRFMTAVQSTQGGELQTTDMLISYQGEISYREKQCKTNIDVATIWKIESSCIERIWGQYREPAFPNRRWGTT